ncbi:MAG: sigW 1, partial [Aeromicrobium sp.]|nr:sigW 1 [Aeromicrobium sp.]
ELIVADAERSLLALEPRLRRAFVARFGWPDGLDVAAEVMEWAWSHREQLPTIANPAGYLYRVGVTRSRRLLRWRREQNRLPAEIVTGDGVRWFEPRLPDALNRLDPEVRAVIVLIYCFQWTYAEVSEVIDEPIHTIRNRVHRGMKVLRIELGAEHD